MMATRTDRSRPFLDKEKLNEFWDKINKRVGPKEEREVLFFDHCTCIKARRGIMSERAILGWKTDIPSYAPLARNEELTGTWFSISDDDDLPRKSPYGSQRMIFKTDDIISYLKKNVQEDENDEIPADTETQENTSEAVDEVLEDPKLFFECVHHYGNKQYVRLLIIRASHPMVTWCNDTCKEIDLHNNPLFEYRGGKLWSRRHGNWAAIIVDVLVVGDIYLDQMPHAPEWSKVGKTTRTGKDPVLGLC